MEYIAHRVNTKEELMEIPHEYGIELDLRDGLDGRIYIQHNPFEPGEDFEEYIQEYNHGTMILNIKSERIELKALELIHKYSVNKYFFLDSTFPMIKLLSDMGEHNIAVRFSEYERLDTIRTLAGKANWVWVDTFTRLPIDRKSYEELKEMSYKLCLVSPELQGQSKKIVEYQRELEKEQIIFDAICTKVYNIPLWRKE